MIYRLSDECLSMFLLNANTNNLTYYRPIT